MSEPRLKPLNPHFSSGPCAKRPGWSLDALSDAPLGRSHRSGIGKEKLKEVIDRHRTLLNIPDDYRIGIVPGSDTGAYEMAMWTMLGARGVEMLTWESFGAGWATDAVKQLKLNDCVVKNADYGQIPDLEGVDWKNDICFTWNGTTSGACVPDAHWIADDREGLSICDATSAVFAMELDFAKLDVTTWSWQKVMGGEAAHGMIVLSPRAVERLESYTPPWPLPKIFRLTKGGKIIEGIFRGETINTPSMLCVEDALDALTWIESIGGTRAACKRSAENLQIVKQWVNQEDWIDFLAPNEDTISSTSICLSISDAWFSALSDSAQRDCIKQISGMLAKENVAYDIAGYRDAPAGLRIWGGATIERDDMQRLLPWLTYAFTQTKNNNQHAHVA